MATTPLAHRTPVTTTANLVRKGDHVVINGEPRLVDLAVPNETTGEMYVDFAGDDLDEHGDPEFFFMNTFDIDAVVSVIPA